MDVFKLGWEKVNSNLCDTAFSLRFYSACKKLGLKYSWSQERVVKHLLKKLAQDQVEELLDVGI